MPNTQPRLPAVGHEQPASGWIGRVIDERYRVVELLGEGGMGAVFVAEQIRLRKQVAFKTIRAEFATDNQVAARFAREALATAQIDHPHVVSAIDHGDLPEGGAYLVLQLVRGKSLANRLKDGPLPWPQACTLGGQIADALAAAHALGIVHRDLKPDNILLEQRGPGSIHARVLDFGIARVASGGVIAQSSEPLTHTGAVLGTPGYMAPEQAVGQQVDFRVDLYALGVILWECCAGRELWRGDSLTSVLTRMLTRPAPSLREVIPNQVPDELVALVDRLLARAPGDRPATAASVRDELVQLARRGDSATGPALSSASGRQPVAASETTLPGHGTTPTLKSGLGRAARPASGIPRIVWFCGAAVVLLVVLLATLGPLGPDKRASSDGVEPAAVGAEKQAEPRRRATVAELVAEVPAAHAEDVKMLLGSNHPLARQLASEAILGASKANAAKMPAYIRDLAQLEAAKDCAAKKSLLDKLDAADEIRSLSALKILARTPTDSCRNSDCLGCLRPDLTRLIERFEAETR